MSYRSQQRQPLRYLRLGMSFVFISVVALLGTPTFAQEGRLVREKVHGPALERNLTGESADRSVSVYLPPSYDSLPSKRYPVVYLLHGMIDTDGTWIFPWTKSGDPWQTVPGVMNLGIAQKRFGEMIIVMPDEKTKWGGSFYTNSTVTGNWEDLLSKTWSTISTASIELSPGSPVGASPDTR